MSINNYQQPLNTKEKIFYAAVKMFAVKGYDSVSMRDLAKEVGITNPAIYNHYSSKKDLLKSIYRFYGEQRKKCQPDVNELLGLVDTEPPHKILNMTEYRYSPDIEYTMGLIIAIAIKLFCIDEDSMQFIRENITSASDEIEAPVLKRMIELNKIEPIDIESFNQLRLCYCFNAVALSVTPMRLSAEKWRKGLDFLYSYIRPINNS